MAIVNWDGDVVFDEFVNPMSAGGNVTNWKSFENTKDLLWNSKHSLTAIQE